VDYTWCKTNSNVVCADYIQTEVGAINCSCRVTFELTDDFPVFIVAVDSSLLVTVCNLTVSFLGKSLPS